MVILVKKIEKNYLQKKNTSLFVPGKLPLVENFGKTAIAVISEYSVGADTTARILRNMVDEEHLFNKSMKQKDNML